MYEYVIRSKYNPEDLENGKVDSEDCIQTCHFFDKPHGRLIDADAFKAYIVESLDRFKGHPNYAQAKAVTDSFCLDIDEAPTVLEASE